MNTIPVSVYIICCNEEAMLGDCLESIARCSEIIIVDSGSTDGTLALIDEYRRRNYPIRLFEEEWQGFARQKQFALEQCKEEWCLNLDADERLDEALLEAIAEAIKNNSGHVAWKVRRREWLPGYGYAHRWVASKRLIRLARRGKASYDTSRLVHESLIPNGTVGTIEIGRLLHFHQNTLKAEIEKQVGYASLKAKQRLARGINASAWRMFQSPVGHFLNEYLLKRYFLCGWAGYAHAVLRSQYAFFAELEQWIDRRSSDNGKQK